jgi:hypothetical protein
MTWLESAAKRARDRVVSTHGYLGSGGDVTCVTCVLLTAVGKRITAQLAVPERTEITPPGSPTNGHERVPSPSSTQLLLLSMHCPAGRLGIHDKADASTATLSTGRFLDVGKQNRKGRQRRSIAGRQSPPAWPKRWSAT